MSLREHIKMQEKHISELKDSHKRQWDTHLVGQRSLIKYANEQEELVEKLEIEKLQHMEKIMKLQEKLRHPWVNLFKYLLSLVWSKKSLKMIQ